jgi:hypothetical protein
VLELGSSGDERASMQGRLPGREQEVERAAHDLGIVLSVRNRLAVVVRGELRGLHVAVGRNALDPLRHPAVQVAALGVRKRAVGDIARERVLERELLEAGHHGFGARQDQPPPAQRGDGLLVDADRRRPEDAPDHRAATESVALVRLEQVDPSGNDAVHGVRDRDLREPTGRGPAAVVPLERTLLDQHLKHLLDEERIALCAREDRPPQVLGHLRLAQE